MNRRDFLGAAAIAPLAAMLPGQTKAGTIRGLMATSMPLRRGIAGEATVWPSLDGAEALSVKGFTTTFPQGAPPLPPFVYGSIERGALRQFGEADFIPHGAEVVEFYRDDERVFPPVEHEDEMAGG